MTDKLVEFLVALSEDTKLAESFKADKKAAMDDFGLGADDQQLIFDGDNEAIIERCGSAAKSLNVAFYTS